MTLSKVLEATDAFIKVLRYGKSDIVTPRQYLAHGIDSKPVKGALALYSDTGNKGQLAVVGYLINSDKTKPGEVRLYSTDSSGVEKVAVHLTNDGIIEVGGNVDNMVRYSKLEEAFNELNDKHNALVNAFNSHLHPTAAVGPPSPPTPVPNVIPAIPSIADISGSKIDEVKTL